jgi:hypothetical protein
VCIGSDEAGLPSNQEEATRVVYISSLFLGGEVTEQTAVQSTRSKEGRVDEVRTASATTTTVMSTITPSHLTWKCGSYLVAAST